METSTENALTTPSPTDWVFDDKVQRLIIATLYCVITVIGVTGNVLVIIAVLLSKRLRTRTNLFVVNLAFADTMTCLMLPFQVVTLLHGRPIYPTLFCVVVAIFLWVSIGSTVINLALIALLRYYIITKPRQRYMVVFRKRNMIMMVCASWLVPFLLVFIPPQFKIGMIGYSDKYKVCTVGGGKQLQPWHTIPDIYLAINGLSLQITCLVVIVFCYVHIYRFVKKSILDVMLLARIFPEEANNRRSAPQTALEAAILRRQVKVARNLFIVMCSYVVCLMPFGLACIIQGTREFIPWTLVVLLFSSCINPIIYALMHRQFQEVIGTYLRWPCQRSTEQQPLLPSSERNNPEAILM